MYQLIRKYPEVILKSSDNLLRLYPVHENAVRITMTGRDHFLQEREGENLTPVVLHKTSLSDYLVKEEEKSVTLHLKSCAMEVELESGRISYFDSTGALVASEPKNGGKHLVETQVYRNVFSGEGGLEERQSVDGVKVFGGEFERVKDRMAYHAKVEFVFGEEGLYGFGSHEEGYGNLRGKSRQLYQQNMKACVPSFVSSKGYGFLFDCHSLMTFEDNAYGSYVWMDVVDELDYYFMIGGVGGTNYRTVLRTYRDLTGAAPMLPKWAFGYGQSKERYQSAAELIEIVEEYRRRNIPLSFIVQDWKSWEEGKWGQKSFDKSRYPDPAAMTQKLHDLGCALMLSIWPNMNGMGENQKEFLDRGMMLGNRSTYNAFRKEARDLYWNQTNEGLFRYGVDAWWCDCSEPFEGDWFGTLRPEPHERLHLNVDVAKKYLDAGEWMAYSLCHSRGIYEGQRKTTDQKRVVNLTRSSFAGQHRYATITWSGDIGANWETLARQIPEGLNFMASGEPYWSLDIGAFFVSPASVFPGKEWFRTGEYPEGCEDLGYRELYTRWLQFGTFLPVMRSHGTDTPREIWRFGEPGTPFYDAIARFIRLRMAMLPYIYSQASAVTMEGDTFLTALGLAFPNDPGCMEIEDEFMFGPSMLVCPVTRPMYYVAGSTPLDGVTKTKKVYLPCGCGWYDFWTGKYYQGGQELQADAPLDRIPVYIKAGSILPMGPELDYPGQQAHPELTLHLYPGSDALFVLYDDEGDSYGYEQGRFSKTPIFWNDSTRTLTIGARQGQYPGMPESQVFHIVLGETKHTVCQEGGQEIQISL